MITISLTLLISCLSRGPVQATLPVYRSRESEQQAGKTIRVMTLNLGHGRGSGLHQLLMGQKQIQKNLHDISEFIRHEGATVVSMQEADGPSFWSGHFDHIRFIADRTHLPFAVRGSHILSNDLDYGTAILSAYPLTGSASVPFSASPPLPSKGYLYSRIKTQEGTILNLVSLHLDFAREHVRKTQLLELLDWLRTQEGLFVIMGDFNMQWTSNMEEFCELLGLKAYRPHENEPTFPKTRRRLDWILVSREIKFIQHTTHALQLSDHYPVSATLLLP